jgi:lipid IVA palmitoyltransferase
MNKLIFNFLLLSLVSGGIQASEEVIMLQVVPPRLQVADCKTVVEKVLELGMNGSTDERLNKLLRAISGECDLNPRVQTVDVEPIFFKFSQSDFKILWDGKKFYFNEKAQATVDFTMPPSFQNIVLIDKDQILSTRLNQSLDLARHTDPNQRHRLGLFDRLVFEISSIQNRLKFIEREGQLRLQFSGYAYHDRGTYDRAKIKELNEKAWGIGIEKLLYVNERVRESVNALWITDSHSDPQFSMAYEWQRRYYKTKGLEFWAGISAGLVLRSDFDYSPIPFILPTLALSYGSVTLKFVVIPSMGGVNNGNVVFGLVSVGI